MKSVHNAYAANICTYYIDNMNYQVEVVQVIYAIHQVKVLNFGI